MEGAGGDILISTDRIIRAFLTPQRNYRSAPVIPMAHGTHFTTTIPYTFAFTAASLRPEIARIVAEEFLSEGGWEAAKRRILRDNALQARTTSSLKRMEREFRNRLESLTPDQLRMLANGPVEQRTAMSWLGSLKHTKFIWDFVVDCLRSKLAELEPTLRHSDYENFVSERLATHPELGELSASTAKKIQTVLFRMLFEAGLAVKGGRELRIQRPVLNPDTIGVIVADNPRLLAGFLWTDSELAGITRQV
ncbi:MAG: DUF1819 family protein [Chthoniobacteraceae bacterium]